jgi:hypothetical protein
MPQRPQTSSSSSPLPPPSTKEFGERKIEKAKQLNQQTKTTPRRGSKNSRHFVKETVVNNIIRKDCKRIQKTNKQKTKEEEKKKCHQQPKIYRSNTQRLNNIFRTLSFFDHKRLFHFIDIFYSFNLMKLDFKLTNRFSFIRNSTSISIIFSLGPHNTNENVKFFISEMITIRM